MGMISERVGLSRPPFVIAEMSGNHGGSLKRALKLVDAVAATGASALKLQTYTPETMTLDLDDPRFRINDGESLWNGRHMYELYEEAHTPWDWHEEIFDRARSHGLVPMSSPFDATAVDLLNELDAACLKIASAEITDLPLIRYAAGTGIPLIISTGMATRAEIQRAVDAAKAAGCEEIALLWCTTAYPAPHEQSRLRGIPHMREWSGLEVGLSDHTLGTAVAVAAVALGASIIEKHVTLDHELATVDGEFSLDPAGLAQLVRDTRTAWSALGEVAYGPSESEVGSLRFRRGLYFVRDLAAGACIGPEDVRSLRPAAALGPDQAAEIVGRALVRAVQRGDEVTREVLA